MLHVAILTRHDDFHAFVVRQVLEDQGLRCSIILTDSMAEVGGLSWSTVDTLAPSTVHDMDGADVVVRELDVIWWRRLTGEPQFPTPLPDDVRKVVVNDCQASLLGCLLTDFGGTWISHPVATRTAHNKLLQLQTAARVGLHIPRTLVSQDPARVRAFNDLLAGQMIVKTVAGAQGVPLMAGLVSPEMLTDESIRLCPAIYQEFIPGTRHLRVCCFGEDIHTAILETETLDWRYPLDAEVQPFQLDDNTSCKIQHLLAELGLRMGIVDMKLAPDGTPMWLEINPQGQFVFLEGMCADLQLTRLFGEFLRREASQAATRRGASA